MSKNSYAGHKDWHRSDKGVKPGHPRDTGHSLHQPGMPHTPFEARGFHEDRGSMTHPERMPTNFTNRHHHDPEMMAPNQANRGHNPLPEHFHKNSGTSSAGHELIRRGAKRMPVA